MLKYHIQTIDLGSGQASVSFSNIPQDFSDLYILLSARTNRSLEGDGFYLRFNNISSGYSQRRLIGNGSSPSSDSQTGVFFTTAANATGNTFGNSSIYVPNYAGNTFKSYSNDGVSENNATTSFSGINAGLWSNTAAISSIVIVPEGGTEFVTNSSFSLYGIKRGSSGEVEVASGGAISYSGGYTIHTFQSSGTFVANRDLDVEYLVVGGGGGGGWNASGWAPGGGGAGGYRCSVQGEMSGGGASAEPKLRVTSGESYLVQVGSGGPAASVILTNGANGGNSSFGAIASLGGGGGGAGSGTNALPGSAGGSGGGGGSNPTASGTKVGGLGTTDQGYSGGAGVAGSDPTIAGGGGGGAGGIGEAGGTDGDGHGGDGGVGITSMISGIAVGRAGGGGGGTYQATVGTGVDGGGNGGRSVNGAIEATNGAENTGGGGGGDNNVNAIMGNGGSGMVIIRYLTPAS